MFSLRNIREADIFTRQEKWDSWLNVVLMMKQSKGSKGNLCRLQHLLHSFSTTWNTYNEKNMGSLQLWPLGLFHTLLENWWLYSLSFVSALHTTWRERHCFKNAMLGEKSATKSWLFALPLSSGLLTASPTGLQTLPCKQFGLQVFDYFLIFH